MKWVLHARAALLGQSILPDSQSSIQRHIKKRESKLTGEELSHMLLSGLEAACVCCARYDIVLYR